MVSHRAGIFISGYQPIRRRLRLTCSVLRYRISRVKSQFRSQGLSLTLKFGESLGNEIGQISDLFRGESKVLNSDEDITADILFSLCLYSGLESFRFLNLILIALYHAESLRLLLMVTCRKTLAVSWNWKQFKPVDDNSAFLFSLSHVRDSFAGTCHRS